MQSPSLEYFRQWPGGSRWMSLYTVLDASELQSCNRKSPMIVDRVSKRHLAQDVRRRVYCRKGTSPLNSQKRTDADPLSRAHIKAGERLHPKARTISLQAALLTLPRATAARPVESALR